MQHKGEVIAITLTPVRHKRHVEFLTSAPNFNGGLVTPLTQLSRTQSRLKTHLFPISNSYWHAPDIWHYWHLLCSVV